MDNVSMDAILNLCSGCGMDADLLKKKLENGEAFKYRGIGKLTHEKLCKYFGVQSKPKLTPLQKKINHAERHIKLYEEKLKQWRHHKKTLAIGNSPNKI